MESVGDFAVQMKAKLAEWAAKAAENEARMAAEHRERMASLPPGTCDYCYGTKRAVRSGIQIDCPRCCPPVLYAEGVPYEFREARIDNYEARPGNGAAIKAAADWVDAASGDLYLHGGVGAGKTRLACSLVNEWYRRRRTCYFVRVPMALYQLQPGRDAEEIAALERRLMTTSLLVLDDVGAERDVATDFTRRTLLMLYEARHDHGLRTIWTSNKNLDELAAMQDDDRLTSRIVGRSLVIKLTTPDQRLRRVK